MIRNILKATGVLGVAGLLFFGGWMIKGSFEEYKEDAALESATEYVSSLTSGRMEDAYNSASEEIRSVKTLDEFSASYGDLTTSDLQVINTTIVKAGKEYEVYQHVDNLPATQDGRTDGVFAVLVSKEGGDWKVSGATVQQIDYCYVVAGIGVVIPGVTLTSDSRTITFLLVISII